MFFWIGIIIILSIGFAVVALKKEEERKEVNTAKKELAKGKVIYHSASSEGSSSSS